MYCTRNLCLV